MDVEFYQELFQHLLRCPMLFIPQFFNMDCQGTPYPFFFYRWLHLLFCFLFIIISLILCSICQHSQNFVLCFLSFLLLCFVLISFVLFLCHIVQTNSFWNNKSKYHWLIRTKNVFFIYVNVFYWSSVAVFQVFVISKSKIKKQPQPINIQTSNKQENRDSRILWWLLIIILSSSPYF